jgi:TonB family protein
MIDWILKPTILIAAAALVCLLTRRAAIRHFAWTLAVTGILVLPAAPEVARFRAEAPVRVPAFVQAVDSTFAPEYAPIEKAPLEPASRIRAFVLIVWYAGIFVALARLVPAWMDVRRLTRDGTCSGRHGRARVLENPQVTTPFTYGFVRPVILLPLTRRWTAERREHVLAHEYAHIERLDWLTQTVSQIACAVYWFHPLVWFAAKRLRAESERACDDAVVRDGKAPDTYAEHLLDLAQTSAEQALPVTVAMWNRSQLEERIMRILENHDRRGLGKLAAVAMSIAAIITIAPIASVRLHAQANTKVTLRGVINDPSGARLPDAKISVIQAPKGPVHDTVVAATTKSGADGSYELQVAPGTWIFMVEVPGMAQLARRIQVDDKQASFIRDYTLNIGQINETVSVAGTRPANLPKPAPQAAKPQRIRVGGNVQAANLLRKVNPEYPRDLQNQGVEGTVELEAVISREGNILNLHPRTKNVNEGLIQSAMNAVNTWQYKPTLLNGEPVEVVTTITVRFYLN